MKELFWNIITPYYCMVSIVVGLFGSLLLNIDRTIYNNDNILSKKRDFIRFVFMYQVSVYECLKDEISIFGIAILEILTTFSVWFLNLILFIILILVMILKFICYLFWIVFRKRNADTGGLK